MTRKVLVATDRSETSDVALAVAVSYTDAQVALLHVMPTLGEERALFPGETEANPDESRQLERRVHEAVLEQAARAGLHAPTVFLDAGVAHEVICERAKLWGADLLVVGTKPPTVVNELLLGSVASRVVAEHQGPVLIAKERPHQGPVFVAIDFSKRSLAALRSAEVEARRRGAPLVAAHVIRRGLASAIDNTVSSLWGETKTEVATLADAHRLMTTLLAQAGCNAQVVAREGGVLDTLLALIGDAKPSLVVLGAHGDSTMRDLAVGTLAARLVPQVGCSVLVTR
jgi:nucleotide-binding universal stress UspA family protein